ncbi:MAG: glycosyltransferase family 4 protein [Longimicrobiales bacterium]
MLHIDGGTEWGGGQNQVRLLVREFETMGLRQLCICPEGSPLEDRLRLEGLPVLGVPWRGGADPRTMIAIARKLGEFHFTHCHDGDALHVALIPTMAVGSPIVATRRATQRVSSVKWNRARRVIAISDSVRNGLLAVGVRGEKIRLVCSGVDAQEVRSLAPAQPKLRDRLGISANSFVAGNIGSLIGYKNQALIVQAATYAADITWVVIGEGVERRAIENAIAARGVAGRVVLAGELPDARRCLLEINAFVSVAAGEGLATSVLDAMAAGVPVFAADSGGAAEVLRPVHDETGAVLFRPGDARELAQMMQRLREEPALRERIVVAQNRRIEDFRIEKTAMATLDVYREVLR